MIVTSFQWHAELSLPDIGSHSLWSSIWKLAVMELFGAALACTCIVYARITEHPGLVQTKASIEGSERNERTSALAAPNSERY